MVISVEHEQAFNQLFQHIYKGNPRAVKLSFDLLHIVHVWDDIIDQDDVSDQDVNKAFVLSLIELPMNPLWTPMMQANMLNVFYRWNDANKIELTEVDDNELAKAWMLRAGVYDMFVLLAGQLYGLEWADEIGPLVRSFYGEKLQDFLSEVHNA